MTDRTRVRRLPDKQVTDRAVLEAILDAGRVAHVAVDDGGQPFALPVGYARDGDRVLVHGSTGSRLFRLLAAGEPACLTVTLLDGLVVARSVFESSMHYRCAMVLGRGQPLHAADLESALHRLSEHLMPGRWRDARPPNPRELAATLVVALPLDEWSVKVSAGPPDDDPADLDWPAWAGVVPLREVLDAPVDAPDLRGAAPVPAYVSSWARR